MLFRSYPLKYEDVSSAPYFPSRQRSAEYREGLYVGYRYYETANIPVLFPFGFGLSYTTFAYSDLKVTDLQRGICECALEDGGWVMVLTQLTKEHIQGRVRTLLSSEQVSQTRCWAKGARKV